MHVCVLVHTMNPYFWLQKNTDCVNLSLPILLYTAKEMPTQQPCFGLERHYIIYYTSGIQASRRVFQWVTESTFHNVKTVQLTKLNYLHKRHCCIFCALAFVPVSERLHCELYLPQTQFLMISTIKMEKN